MQQTSTKDGRICTHWNLQYYAVFSNWPPLKRFVRHKLQWVFMIAIHLPVANRLTAMQPLNSSSSSSSSSWRHWRRRMTTGIFRVEDATAAAGATDWPTHDVRWEPLTCASKCASTARLTVRRPVSQRHSTHTARAAAVHPCCDGLTENDGHEIGGQYIRWK